MAALRAETKDVTDDRQHFVDSLAQAMNEITHLRNKYDVFEEWAGEEEEWQDDDLEAWYEVDDAHVDAAGVSSYLDADCMDRVRKAVAPLKPVLPQKQTGEPDGPKDILWAAKKASQDAAAAASDMSQKRENR